MLDWLVGVGDVSAKRVLPAILAESHSRLAGIVTRDPTKADSYGVPWWRDVETALSVLDAGAVYIATPVFLHAPQTITALRAGRHVLCESRWRWTMPKRIPCGKPRRELPDAGDRLLPAYVSENSTGEGTDRCRARLGVYSLLKPNRTIGFTRRMGAAVG
jgi:hypothetical protein